MVRQYWKKIQEQLPSNLGMRAGYAIVALTVLLTLMMFSPDSANPDITVQQNDVDNSKDNIQTFAPKLTKDEEELLAQLVRAEAEAEPYDGKVAVAAVVLNRLHHPEFPDSVREIVYQPSQFEPVLNGTINKPARPVDRAAVRDALQGWDPSEGAIYFFNPAKTPNAFVWSRPPIKMIANHQFTS